MHSTSAKPTRRRELRAAFAVASALLWLVAAAVALEVWARWQQAGRAEAAEAHFRNRGATVIAAESGVLERLGMPAPLTGTDFKARHDFFSLDDTGRAAHATGRGEAVILLADDRQVDRVYLPEATEIPRAFGRQVRAGDTLEEYLSDDAAGDLLNALDIARGGGGQQLRDYPVTLPEVGEAVAQLAIVANDSGQVAVFVRPSMWQELWVNFRPNVRQDDAYTFETNAQGWRSGPVMLPKPEGVYRIVCVGGSTTAEGKTNALTYPSLLERKLRERLGTDRVEVVNAGVFASTAFAERDRLARYLALEPDLVVHYNVVNDITYSLPAWLSSRAAWKNWLSTSHWVYNRWNRLLLPADEVLVDELNERVFQPLGELAEGVRAVGVDMAFASFATPDYDALPQVERDFFDLRINTMHGGRMIGMAGFRHIVNLYNQRLASWCAERGVAYLPVAEALGGGLDTFTDICHMNLDGIDRKADVFAALLAPTVERALEQTDAGA